MADDTTARWKKGRRKATRLDPNDRRLFGLPLKVGEVVGGKYAITGVLGQGGMGAVYRGEHVNFRREVAIKVLHPMLSREKMMVRRFEREAQAAGRIGSEHITEVLDTGTFAGGERFMVMEFLEGESLAERFDRVGTLSPTELYPIAVQMLEGLKAAHAADFVHRDLKPSNVFLVRYEGREDFVKILDFGVSKLNAIDAGDVTQTGVLLGTPHFMAPELIRGARHADHRADLYAVGVILYRGLAGMTPFVATNAYELLHKISREDAPPVRHFAPGIDAHFAAIVDAALVRDPDRRYPDAASFLAALEAWNDGSMELPPLRTPRGSVPPPERATPTVPRRAAPPPIAPSPIAPSLIAPLQRPRVGLRAPLMLAIFVAGAAAATALQLSSTEAKHATGGLALIGVEVASTVPTQMPKANDADPEPLDETLGPPAAGVVPEPTKGDALESDLVEPPPAPAPPPPPQRVRSPQAPVVGEVEF